MFDDELESFKTKINLSEYAASRGYALDKRESSRNSAAMRHPDGDKIVIAREESGFWIYFSIRNALDNGTIIDFVQHRDGGSLGKVRQTLRPWLNKSRPSSQPLAAYVQELLPIVRDRNAVIKAFEEASVCYSLPYLAGRGLGAEALTNPLFSGRVRVDQRGNALFPHYDRKGLCGYEMKNKGFTGFAPGGGKGLWFSKADLTDRFLVLTESAIDAISYHLLHPSDPWARYMSTGGELNPQQPALLRGAMEKLPQGATVLLAFDRDEGGEKIASEIKAVAPANRDMERVTPDDGFKDWNEVLMHRLGLG